VVEKSDFPHARARVGNHLTRFWGKAEFCFSQFSAPRGRALSRNARLRPRTHVGDVRASGCFTGLAPLWPGLVRVTLSCVNMRGLYGWSKNRDLARARARAVPLDKVLGERGISVFRGFKHVLGGPGEVNPAEGLLSERKKRTCAHDPWGA